jgi:hypothetical protein
MAGLDPAIQGPLAVLFNALLWMAGSEAGHDVWGNVRQTERSSNEARTYFFLTFCVSAEAATDLAALLAFGSCRILDAADATFLPVVSFTLFVCVRADAATDFSALVAVLLFKTFDAADETLLLVTSDFAMDVASLF